MSYNIGGPSNTENNILSSSSSDDDDNDNMLWMYDLFSMEEDAMHRVIQNNSMVLELTLSHLNNCRSHGGSIPGHVVINRNQEAADRNLWNDYFSENPRYNVEMFRRRYRMSRSLFLRIVGAVKNHDSYFQQRCDGLSRGGLSTAKNYSQLFRMLAYGLPCRCY
ncbi:uncharacterized protein LOC120270816 [Dioscorea cayenensis subsp. rotundata]|uniref:Uncharacterized protein LOC120270816 n=1 Tax=Dioscorea cayennensis subsp. rotundata TaxID=55577 RepID=A0AB40C4W0_DIOCR|nr:uncharacterized protein LOC120270816 [Dioscorea cayenensis subsp. rotundata]